MTWDDELEALAEKAYATFGDAAVGNAFVRAVFAAPAMASVPLALEDILSDETLAHAKCVDAETSAEYFKAELRRMLTQH